MKAVVTGIETYAVQRPIVGIYLKCDYCDNKFGSTNYRRTQEGLLIVDAIQAGWQYLEDTKCPTCKTNMG